MLKKNLIDLTSKITKDSCPYFINFHCHTTFSDGSLRPEQLLDEAYKNNTKFISITDHHTLKAYLYIKKYDLLAKYPNNSLNVITGIEINCLLNGCLVHVLGLGFDIESKSLLPYTSGESAVGNYLQISEVVKAINSAGGISILAHPARYRIPFNILINAAYENNIDGIEVWYDYSLNETWKPSEFICDEIEKLTNKLGLLKSCGTDSHGFSLLGR